jgi:two-component system, LytTR family, sensor kinase
MYLLFFRRYKLDHILFWLLYTFFWLLVSGSFNNPSQIFHSLVVVFFHASASYFNIYVLVPLLLQKQKYIAYGLSLLLSITLTCFPLAFAIYYSNPHNSPDNLWSEDFFIFNTITTSYAVAITMILRLMLHWYQREKEKAELQQLTTETELKYLKSQINPHFLFNCLNSIYSLTLKKSDDAPQTVLKLSDMLRYLLYEAAEEKVTIDKEINYLKNYLELEKIRLGNRGQIIFEVNTDSEDYEIEPMLLMPFVENSFKHGLNTKATEGWVNIVLSISNGKLHFKISNNKGAKSFVNTEYTVGGIGIENVRKRLQLLYPSAHLLQLEDEENVYTVGLELELE